MFMKLLLLFTITPLVELYILFKVSDITGPLATVLLVLLTGIAGAYLAKSEGRMIIRKIKLQLNSGEIPGNELLNGLCVLIGGALLLTPGLLTDILGFSLVLPGVREIFKGFLKVKFKKMIDEGNINIHFR